MSGQFKVAVGLRLGLGLELNLGLGLGFGIEFDFKFPTLNCRRTVTHYFFLFGIEAPEINRDFPGTETA